MTKQSQLLILALLASTGIVLTNMKVEDPKYDQILLTAQEKANQYITDKQTLISKYQLTDYTQAMAILEKAKIKPLTMEEWEIYAKVYDMEIKKQGEIELTDSSFQVPVLLKQQIELNLPK